jgi:formate/nitrite transporter FocA (FNT family)
VTGATDPFLLALDAERRRVSTTSQRGIGMPAAGMLFWLGVAWLTRHFPIPRAVFYSFFLTGPVFPVGVALTKLAGGNLFSKSAGLTSLGLLLAALQMFFWPIIGLVFVLSPAWTPWAMAILFGSHFLPYAWLHRSRAYAFLSGSVAVSLTTLALITHDPQPTRVPLITAACYAIAIAWMAIENRQLREDAVTVLDRTAG